MGKRGRVYNQYFSEEKWALVNPINKAILEDFVQEYKQRKMAKGTINGYLHDLRIVFIYILDYKNNKSILDLKKKDFRAFSLWLSDDNNLSNSRVNRIKSALNSMLTFCEEDEDYHYDINFAKKVKGLPTQKVKTDTDDFFFSYKEFMQVRNKLLELNRLRDSVLWSLAFDSGARRNEIFQVQKYGLVDSNRTNTVIGKRGKTFPLIYLDDTKELIRKYLELRGEDDVDSLWYKVEDGQHLPVSKEWIYNRIVSISDILSEIRNEECNIFPHTCRHSRAECLVQGQDDRLKNSDGTNRKYTLDEVKVFLHHEDISTTSSYMMNHDDDVINDMFGIK